MSLPPPLGLLAELTHRCPLSCPYCSNPLDLERRSGELDTATWLRVFEEAAALGVLQLHLSGGEPTSRSDLGELVGGAARAGLYTNLITSGIGMDELRLKALAEAGLDHVQLSVQHVNAAEADRIAGYAGAHAKKRALAREIARIGLPLTINAVIHRANIDAVEAIVRDAMSLGARRIEVAHSQYYGWALKNRAALIPSTEQAAAARKTVERLRAELRGIIVIDYVAPDYFARFPKPCMNGWGRQSLNVTPSGRVLPCHAAETIPGLTFWSVRDRPLGDIWAESPAFNAFRGTGWMREPCLSCPRKEIDFGGCRCQALALTGDARNTDPVCVYSPARALVTAASAAPPVSAEQLAYRRYAASRSKSASGLSVAVES
jgi:pyrroloquinoline quinone biosynthesis protein E